MDVAKPYANFTFLYPTTDLGLFTESIKGGIQYTRLLIFEGQLAHDVRVNALKNVGLGWLTMTWGESVDQLRCF